MNRLRIALVFVLIVASTAALADSGPAAGQSSASATRLAAPVAGTWRLLPAAPIAPDAVRTSVWTGTEMIIAGVALTRAEDGAIVKSVNVAAAYNPATRAWRRLPAAPGPTDLGTGHSAVWTGKEMLVTSAFSTLAYDPRTNHWRRVARGHGGLVVWTGRELIGWGGGCCGDAFSDGVAFNPATNAWRKLARSPLAGSQHPIGAWTGKELIVFVGNLDPDGKPWPARLARAAAYNPVTDSWRRIAPLPAPRNSASAVWDGRELLLVGGASAGLAYTPATNRWRRLPRTESHARTGAAAVWTGKRLFVWGGQGSGGEIPAHGLAYDPATNRWSPLPPAPILGRVDPTAVWTGGQLIVWGGGSSTPPFTDGATFTPTAP